MKGDEGDDTEETKKTKGDRRQRRQHWRQRRQQETQGMKGDGEGRRTSHFNAYLYLIQAIYMKAEAEKALGETQRQHADPAT